jgi:hypothetical protein
MWLHLASWVEGIFLEILALIILKYNKNIFLPNRVKSLLGAIGWCLKLNILKFNLNKRNSIKHS